MNKYYGSRPLIGTATPIYISNFITDVLNMDGERSKLPKTHEEACLLRERLSHTTVNVSKGNYKDTSELVESPIRVDFIKSNLGRGYIFYFICNGCGKRRKYLYTTPYNYNELCRECHRLIYQKQIESDKRIQKLIKNPELMYAYANSEDSRKSLLAIEAIIIRDELERKAEENALKRRIFRQ